MEKLRAYGLIGNPLEHSFSKGFFAEFFKRHNINATYDNFELPDIGDLMEMVAENPDLQGFNITSPYKELIIPYLDEMNDVVSRIGACNVVKIERGEGNDLKFKGYNSDYEGFKQTLEWLNPKIKSALILGTGGASKAVEAALADMGFAVKKVSRKPSDAQLSYADLPDCINDFFLIVNCTPIGTYPDDDKCPDLPFDRLNARHLCYDLVYNPAVTTFMRRAAEKGCVVKNGEEMLVNQALISWRIWNS